MAEVAINMDGTEVIGDNLVRGYYTKRGSLILEGDYYRMDESKYTEWVYPYYNPDEGVENIAVVLPTGTIEKIIGRTLTFNDGPVEI